MRYLRALLGSLNTMQLRRGVACGGTQKGARKFVLQAGLTLGQLR